MDSLASLFRTGERSESGAEISGGIEAAEDCLKRNKRPNRTGSSAFANWTARPRTIKKRATHAAPKTGNILGRTKDLLVQAPTTRLVMTRKKAAAHIETTR